MIVKRERDSNRSLERIRLAESERARVLLDALACAGRRLRPAELQERAGGNWNHSKLVLRALVKEGLVTQRGNTAAAEYGIVASRYGEWRSSTENGTAFHPEFPPVSSAREPNFSVVAKQKAAAASPSSYGEIRTAERSFEARIEALEGKLRLLGEILTGTAKPRDGTERRPEPEREARAFVLAPEQDALAARKAKRDARDPTKPGNLLARIRERLASEPGYEATLRQEEELIRQEEERRARARTVVPFPSQPSEEAARARREMDEWRKKLTAARDTFSPRELEAIEEEAAALAEKELKTRVGIRFETLKAQRSQELILARAGLGAAEGRVSR